MAFGSVVDYNDNVRGVRGHRRICVLWFGVGCQADSAIIAGAETWVGLGMRPPHLQWTTMGWLPVLICNLVTSLITSMMVLRLEHLPSGSQLIIWNCVTWWAFHDCSKR